MLNTADANNSHPLGDEGSGDKAFTDELEAAAIVGMALRVPGADSLEQFWQNLRDGVESISFFNDDQLRAAGVPESALSDPDFVKAFGLLEGADQFDNDFFDILPREAEILDPQHRQLLECSWQALEHAGYGPNSQSFSDAGSIGMMAGVGLNNYLLHNLAGRKDVIEALGGWQLTLGNDKDFAATRVAYKLNLCGAAMNVSTACSTSLVSVAMACQSLLSYQSDMMLAGGCSIHLPQDQGYWYHPGGTLSSDGHCRAFDEQAQGTLDGNGVAVVVLKRLDDAIKAKDTIYGVVRGFAVNNDGGHKVGYTAPSVEGQSAVIREAQEMAEIGADTLGYVETHGTGTDLGDQVEITALTEAFREAGITGKQVCGLGSVKTNVGHLDTAAGTTGLIKTVLGLKHGQIPPSLHFTRANPKLHLDTSPFYVNAALRDWPRLKGAPRRGGVSSFGIGGTNAHVIVEEAPAVPAPTPGRPWQMLALSAKTQGALQQNRHRLANYLACQDNTSLADIAYTLQTGRCAFKQRQAVVSSSCGDGADKLNTLSAPQVFCGEAGEQAPAVAFMFPGQDAQYAGMAESLYRDEPLFKQHIDLCDEIVRREHGIDLLSRLFAGHREADAPDFSLDPLPIFVTEYALARSLLALGIQPRAMMGSSLGEYVCACLAEVISLEDALMLAISCAELFSLVEPGALLSVSLSQSELQPLLGDGLALAMVCAPKQCVVGGRPQAVAALKTELAQRGASYVDSPLDLPFHTEFMQPLLAPYRARLQQVKFSAPKIPFVSCVTGDWIDPEQARDPEHYLRLAVQRVELSKGFQRLFSLADCIFLEVGPGQSMTGFALLQQDRPAGAQIIPSLSDPRYAAAQELASADSFYFQSALARLWVAGLDISWPAFYRNQARRRIALPGYAFEHKRYWLDAQPSEPLADGRETEGKQADPAHWFYRPCWQELARPAPADLDGQWLVIGEPGGLATPLVEHLRAAGVEVVCYSPASLATAADWDAVFAVTGGEELSFDHLVYLGLLDQQQRDDSSSLEAGFYPLLALGQSLGRRVFSDTIKLTLLTDKSLSVGGGEITPANAAVLGPLLVLPQEYPNLQCRMIDVQIPELAWQRARLLDDLLAEFTARERIVALRAGQRWAETFEPDRAVSLPEAGREGKKIFRDKGVYLITGGLGNIGLALAECIARQTSGVHLVLTTRRASLAAGSERLQKVKMLETLGASVQVAHADCSDEAAMKALLDEVEQHFVQIHGVIHAAGLVGQESFATVGESSREFCIRQFTPKLQGVRVLEQVLADRPLDFCILCSSLSSVLGGLGFAAYAGANACLDSFVIAHNQRHASRWISVNWEGWRFDDELDNSQAGAALAELSMSPAEGLDIFERILQAPHRDRLVISSGDLKYRMQQWVAPKETLPPVANAAATHARPAMLGEYIAPSGEVELQIAQLWESLLGISGIGADDSFFELGGNSLLMTQLLAQIRKIFRQELSLTLLFERPTIADIAGMILQVQQDSREAEAEREEGVL
ncbi:type I polyketide synthase [Thalassomonas sp. RHCl1]|uniref:type I polyketide synthase n=1 Tax=Thalassomonas sp. RHCl1 TaxID=2995320 RepID=UPI00248C8B6E|nr:type I polyketide synthase [Thalassomonas sp. RHCl1]